MRARPIRLVVLALPLTLGVLAVGAGSATAQTYNWGDNGSQTCTLAQGAWSPSQASAQLGTYCMMAVTGWIWIGPGMTQVQAMSCASNAPGGSPGLSWSIYNNTIDDTQANGMPWYQLANGPVKASPGSPADTTANVTGMQTNGYGLAIAPYPNPITVGSVSTGTYGSGGMKVQNPRTLGPGVSWQGALACVNSAGAALQGAYQMERAPQAVAAPRRAESQVVAPARRARIADLVIDAVDAPRGRAFLAKQYVLKRNVTRTATRTCPAGMARTGKLTYTVQEFPANGRAPRWTDRSLVDIALTPRGRNAGRIEMTLTRAKNPTVVQFQMRCARR